VPFSVIAFLRSTGDDRDIHVVLSALGPTCHGTVRRDECSRNHRPRAGRCRRSVRQFLSASGGSKVGAFEAMLLGRLELFTVLVLFRPEFWR